MARIILLFGVISGVVVGGSLLLSSLVGEQAEFSVWIGYLLMLLALSLIFIAVRRYRDEYRHGQITFVRGLLVGAGITLVASCFYVAAWELALVLTDYAFIDDYGETLLEQAAAAPQPQRAEREAEIAAMQARYRNPLFRLPVTFLEIFPVGLLVSAVCAGLLRRRSGPSSTIAS
jgi:hypothetical protein